MDVFTSLEVLGRQWSVASSVSPSGSWFNKCILAFGLQNTVEVGTLFSFGAQLDLPASASSARTVAVHNTPRRAEESTC